MSQSIGSVCAAVPKNYEKDLIYSIHSASILEFMQEIELNCQGLGFELYTQNCVLLPKARPIIVHADQVSN